LVSQPLPNPEQSDADQLEAAADQAIAACGGNLREAVKALIVANHFLETELEKLRAAVSTGYARGQLLPRDRKDWYD
jgi:regulator of replication initiation timing